MSYLSIRKAVKKVKKYLFNSCSYRSAATALTVHTKHMNIAAWGDMYFSGNSGSFWGTYHDAWIT